MSRLFLAFGFLLAAGLLLWLLLGSQPPGNDLLRRYSFDLLVLAAAAAFSFITAFSSRLRGWVLSMRVGLVILVMVAAASFIGVVFTQDATPQEYEARFGAAGYRVLNALGFLSVFGAGWYRALIFALAYVVTSCSLGRAGSLLRLAFRPSFRMSEGEFAGLAGPPPFQLRVPPDEAAARAQSLLARRGYRRLERRDGEGGAIGLFSSRGRISRLGTLAIHLSLAFILAGGYVAATAGFRYLQWAGVGDTFTVRGAGYQVRVDSFEIPLTPEGRVRDYLAGLTVLEEGREILSQTVEVNVPLKHRGVNIYQSSYRTDGRSMDWVSFQLENAGGALLSPDLVLPLGEPVTVDELGLTLEAVDFVADFVMDVETREVRSRSHDPLNPAVKVRFEESGREPYEEWIFFSGARMHQAEGRPYNLRFGDYEPRFVTGLEVARQPGLILVWVGFGLLALGTVVSLYIDHRRVWVLVQGVEPGGRAASRVRMGGSSNRDPHGLLEAVNGWGRELVG